MVLPDLRQLPEVGAMYLYQCAKNGGSDNLVWDLLARTGDDPYTEQTFLKAAELVLREAIVHEVTA
jgi:hypothetical protein